MPPVLERAKTFRALDLAATLIGKPETLKSDEVSEQYRIN
jgi:hypothetical protein